MTTCRRTLLAAYLCLGIAAPLPAAGKADASGHWAFRPVGDPTPPAVRHAERVSTPIDAFILAKLEEKGLSFAPPADKLTLLRRATFDLTGLPPTPEEVDAFLADDSPDAFARVVERLLASPHYGERWGRYWLDLARFADTKGYVFQEDRNYPYAYTYRDYVIRAFNEDLPYDTFIRHQLAADRMELGEDKTPLAAMGFLTLGRRFLNNRHDIIDDRIDVVSRTFLGLTVSCARCHDHKYDPIPTADYYSLYGVFASTEEPKELPLIEEPPQTPEAVAFRAELQKREAEVRAFVEKRHGEILAELRTPEKVADYLAAVRDARGKSPDELRGFTRERGLRRSPFTAWREYLEKRATEKDPVFAIAAALGRLPDADFSRKAPEIIAAMTEGKSGGVELNPLVAEAFRGQKPASFRDVALVYGKLLGEAARLPKDAPASPEREALRRVLLGEDSPLNIPADKAEGLFDRADRNRLRELQRQVDQFRAKSPVAPARAMVLTDSERPFQPYVFVRGNPGNRGEEVPRRFLQVLAGADREPFRDGSGRLELADAIADPDNPLTARVMVNRVWMHHFGEGLVGTPSDFGLRSEPPTHPELLDYLARRFMEPAGRSAAQSGGRGEQGGAWSLKKLHRLIMLSQVYQQSSDLRPELRETDPDNRLLARMNRRRLDWEATRDSLLAVAGRLDRTVGGRSVELFKEPYPTRRSLYGFIDRQNLPGVLRSFDFAIPDTHCPRRFVTTVPQQGLYLMNNAFVIEQAKALAAREEVARETDPERRITVLYRLCFGRAPDAEEMAMGRAFVAGGGSGGGSALTAWERYAQVLLLSNEFAFVD